MVFQNSSVRVEKELTIDFLLFSLLCQLHLNIFLLQERGGFILFNFVFQFPNKIIIMV